MTPQEGEAWPRQYAQRILEEPDRRARQAILEGAPARLRDLIRTHVEQAWARRRQPRQ